LLQNIFSEDIG